MRPGERTRELARDLWPELQPETPVETYRNDMARRLREADKLGRGVRTLPAIYYGTGPDPSLFHGAPYDPGMRGGAMTLEYRPEREQPQGLYRTYPRMPRIPIRRGGKALLDPDIRYRLLPEVLDERSQGFDRALGTTHFNFRNVSRYNDNPKEMVRATWRQTNSAPRFVIGPLDNSFPRSHVDPHGLDDRGVYANFYNEVRP